MVCCSASGCSNRGEKGFSMKSFPKDPNMRKKWKDNVNREGWEPTNYSCLCEVHFIAEMWEKPREDGKKKLKWDAIPTVFPKPKMNKKEKNEIKYLKSISNYTQTDYLPLPISDPLDPIDRLPCIPTNSFVSQYNENKNMESKLILNVSDLSVFHNYALPPPQLPIDYGKMNSDTTIQTTSGNSSTSVFSESNVSNVNTPQQTINNVDLFKKIYQYQKSYTHLQAKINCYKSKLNILKVKNEKLEKMVKNDKHLKLLKHVFNNDQICSLERHNHKFMKWTQSTLVKALRLKNYCGKDGYEEILRQKIPLPSLRTLNRVKTTNCINEKVNITEK